MARRRTLWLLLTAFCIPLSCRPAPHAPGNVTIRTSYWGMAQEAKIWEELAAEFQRKHPHIRIQLEHIAGQNYHSKVLAMTVGRCAPDVLAADDEQFRQLAKNGLYADLTPLIAADREVQPARFYRSLWDSFRVGEKQYALPYIGNCLLVFYNRDHRRAAGLTPDPDPNWDWDGFNRDAVALTRDLDGDGRTDQFGLNRLTWFYCLQWVWDAGGTDMDPSMTRYVFDTPEAKRGFQFHYDHMHKWKVCPMTGDLPNMNAESMFLTGKVSMVIAGSWWLVQAARAKNFEWDVAAMPRGPVARTTRVTGEGIAISPQCKHRREAWEWVKFVAGQEGQAIFAKYGRGIPSFRDMARSRYPNPRTPQHEERFLDAMEYARISSLHEHFIATEAVFNREWDRLTLGQLTVEEWIKKTLPEVNAIIRGEDL